MVQLAVLVSQQQRVARQSVRRNEPRVPAAAVPRTSRDAHPYTAHFERASLGSHRFRCPPMPIDPPTLTGGCVVMGRTAAHPLAATAAAASPTQPGRPLSSASGVGRWRWRHRRWVEVRGQRPRDHTDRHVDHHGQHPRRSQHPQPAPPTASTHSQSASPRPPLALRPPPPHASTLTSPLSLK